MAHHGLPWVSGSLEGSSTSSAQHTFSSKWFIGFVESELSASPSVTIVPLWDTQCMYKTMHALGTGTDRPRGGGPQPYPMCLLEGE